MEMRDALEIGVWYRICGVVRNKNNAMPSKEIKEGRETVRPASCVG